MTNALIIFGVALFLGTMLFSLLLVAAPKSVKLVRPLICPRGTELDVKTFDASSGQYRAKGITIEAVGPDGRQDVKGRALILLWALCCLACALPSAVIVLLVARWIASIQL